MRALSAFAEACRCLHGSSLQMELFFTPSCFPTVTFSNAIASLSNQSYVALGACALCCGALKEFSFVSRGDRHVAVFLFVLST